MQLYVESDPRITYFDLVSEHADEFSRFAAFDLVANNADRKGGHCLLGADGTVWSIDHGLTFHADFKLRTVMLEFWGEPLPDALLPDLTALADRLSSTDGLRDELRELLTNDEVDVLLRRTETVLADPVFPRLDPHRNIPWPWSRGLTTSFVLAKFTYRVKSGSNIQDQSASAELPGVGQGSSAVGCECWTEIHYPYQRTLRSQGLSRGVQYPFDAFASSEGIEEGRAIHSSDGKMATHSDEG